MPPHATHRLNLSLTPSIERSINAALLKALWAELQGRQLIDQRGRAGSHADALVQGGFALLRVDRPPGLAVYGNRVGGFHVNCPGCEGALPKEWGAALAATHAGRSWELRCPRCARELSPNEVITAPPARIARFALELRDVGSPELLQRALFEPLLGRDFRVVATRS